MRRSLDHDWLYEEQCEQQDFEEARTFEYFEELEDKILRALDKVDHVTMVFKKKYAEEAKMFQDYISVQRDFPRSQVTITVTEDSHETMIVDYGPDLDPERDFNPPDMSDPW